MSTPRANEWKKKTRTGQELELPSGNRAMVRKPDMLGLAKVGNMPNFLTVLALRGLDPERAKTEGEDYLKTAPKEQLIVEMAQSLEIVTRASLVDPYVTDDADDENGVLMSDVPLEDQVMLLGFALGADAVALQRFLDNGQNPPVEPVPDESDVQPTTEQNFWNQKSQ